MVGPCFVMQYLVSLVVLQKRERLLKFSCLPVTVLWLYLMVSQVRLKCVNVVFSGYTHILSESLSTVERTLRF